MHISNQFNFSTLILNEAKRKEFVKNNKIKIKYERNDKWNGMWRHDTNTYKWGYRRLREKEKMMHSHFVLISAFIFVYVYDIASKQAATSCKFY